MDLCDLLRVCGCDWFLISVLCCMFSGVCCGFDIHFEVGSNPVLRWVVVIMLTDLLVLLI
jgi:hypothetical protein